jgi:hypothetical protein
MNEQELEELIKYYQSIEIPKTLKYSESTFFNDLPKAISADIYTLKTYGLIPTFAGSYERLVKIKELLEKGEGK